MRCIVWFDPEHREAVLVVLAQNKARLGDIFYDSIGDRADAIIEEYKRVRKYHDNK